jgi:Mlc titration factor MtfA (ptsG expression regulator)
MTFPQIIIAALGLAVLILFLWAVLGRGRRRRQRRSQVRSQPFPESWEAALRRDFGLYELLPAELRRALQEHMLIFLDEKRFEACGGLEKVDESLRVLIAAQACLLLLGLKDHGHYPRLRSVLVYPGAYHDARRRTFELPDSDDRETRLGESWTTGSVVLSAESVVAGARNEDDGMNVVMHEFAHQLDQADGLGDGAPILEHSADFEEDDYEDWARVLGENFEEMLDDLFERRRPILDPYGATNPAEFFAVATETFFEEPERLRREAPDLYAAMRKYYGLDPAAWG